MRISRIYKYVFIHIPCTGGTSISAMIPGLDHNKLNFSHAHLRARDIKEEIDNYNNLFSFAMVRHPLDRLYSIYRYKVRNMARLRTHKLYYINNIHTFEYDFKTWLLDCESWSTWDINKERPPSQLEQQAAYLTEDNKLIVNHVARFENFNKEFNNVLSKINININNIKHLNKSSPDVKYHDIYDNEMLDFVYDKHSIDINLFGYEL